jgi:hypothetical protein
VLYNQKKVALVAKLSELGFTPFASTPSSTNDNNDSSPSSKDDASSNSTLSRYDYLLNQPIGSLTHERMTDLRKLLSTTQVILINPLMHCYA